MNIPSDDYQIEREHNRFADELQFCLVLIDGNHLFSITILVDFY